MTLCLLSTCIVKPLSLVGWGVKYCAGLRGGTGGGQWRREREEEEVVVGGGGGGLQLCLLFVLPFGAWYNADLM